MEHVHVRLELGGKRVAKHSKERIQNSKKSHFNIPHNYLDIVFLWGVVRIRKRFRSIEPALLRQFPWLMK